MKRFTGSSAGAWEDTGHTDTGLTVTVSGLAAETSYEVWVRAVNGEGVGPWSAIATATTTAAPNAPPLFSSGRDPSAWRRTRVTVGTVAATDGDAGDEITGYEIDAVAAEIGDGALFAIADGALFAIDAGTGALTFKNAPNYEAPADADTDNEYIVVVTATGGAGDRALTTATMLTVTVTDDETEAPSAPAVPTISAATADGFTVTWTAPANSGPAILDYTVRYRVGTGGSWQQQTGVAGTSLALTGLSAATEYQVGVRARNAEGRSAWSPQTTATTTAVPNAAPVFTSAATFSVAENTTAVGTVAAMDANVGDEITGYAITGGADRALFAIDAGTGALTFISAHELRRPAGCRNRRRRLCGGGDGDGRRGRPRADGRADDRGDGDGCDRAAFGPGDAGDFGGRRRTASR